MTDRIQFRIAVTVYRCLHDTAPEYMSELFVFKTHGTIQLGPATTSPVDPDLRRTGKGSLFGPNV